MRSGAVSGPSRALAGAERVWVSPAAAIALALGVNLPARRPNRLAHGAGNSRSFHASGHARTDGRLKNNHKFSTLTAGTARKNKAKKNLRQNLYYPILLSRIRLRLTVCVGGNNLGCYDATNVKVI